MEVLRILAKNSDIRNQTKADRIDIDHAYNSKVLKGQEG